MPDPEWFEKAAKARKGAGARTGTKRARYISGKSEIWTELRPMMVQMSAGKCWYCETKIKRDYHDIDHFRPKNEVEGAESDYWWLAFDHTNYRLACPFCNRERNDDEFPKVGKGTHFPLLNPSERATCPEDDLSREIIKLLDPTNPGDPDLLNYNEYGLPITSSNACTRELKERVDESIIRYHLKCKELVNSRRTIAANIDKYVQRINDGKNVEACKENLRCLIQPHAEYLSHARRCLCKHFEHQWVQDMLATT